MSNKRYTPEERSFLQDTETYYRSLAEIDALTELLNEQRALHDTVAEYLYGSDLEQEAKNAIHDTVVAELTEEGVL